MEKKEENLGGKKVHLKLKIGNIDLEIDCEENQIRNVVDKVLSSVSEFTDKSIVFPQPKEVPIRAETCRGVLEKLWKEGWFSDLRSLADVHVEMTRIGYHYDRTAVSHVLLDMVRDGVLSREGKPRRYSYTQKRPPNPHITL
jgi:hypothetical protein